MPANVVIQLTCTTLWDMIDSGISNSE